MQHPEHQRIERDGVEHDPLKQAPTLPQQSVLHEYQRKGHACLWFEL